MEPEPIMVSRLTLLAALATAIPAAGQSPAPAPGATPHNPSLVGGFVRDFGHDQKVIWTSPFHTNKRRWLTTVLPLAAGTAALIAVDQRGSDALPNTHDQIAWSNHIAEAGLIYALVGATAGPIVAGKFAHNPQIARTGRRGTEAVLDALVVVMALKYPLGRQRPDDPGSGGHFFHGGDSFPSAHAVTAFAGAAAIGHDRHTPRWLKITCYVAAGTASLARISGRRHYPADVLVGGVFGELIGRYVAHKPEP
ncbi:MAG TPA: phosphatase PAP2 family protein [Candidatus Acidoferrales bacterium]|nr:phosphatase PAP2 family protein [Candidatus Acidoferrales bacterium]